MTYIEHKNIFIFAICSALILPSIAVADIAMPKNIFYIDQTGKNTKMAFRTTTVKNTNDNRVFNVVSRVFKVEKSNGQISETRSLSDEVSVFPPFFTLRPNQTQKIRIIAKTGKISDDVESAYRVQFLPKVPADDQRMLEIVTTMGALVFVKPTEVTGGLAWKRNNEALIIKNKSNTNIVLRNSSTCKKTFSCITNGLRLWPNNSLKITTPSSLSDRTIILEKSTYGISENVRISK
jgi:P pilus assembly chaperone PapD